MRFPKEYDHINLAAKHPKLCACFIHKTLFFVIFNLYFHTSTRTCTFIDSLIFFQKICKYTICIYIYTCVVCVVYICIICVCSDIVTHLHFGAIITPKEVSKSEHV